MNETPSWSELWDDFKYLLRSFRRRVEEDLDIKPEVKSTIIQGSWAELLKPGLAKAINNAMKEYGQK